MREKVNAIRDPFARRMFRLAECFKCDRQRDNPLGVDGLGRHERQRFSLVAKPIWPTKGKVLRPQGLVVRVADKAQMSESLQCWIVN
jgi:hypothetical protein